MSPLEDVKRLGLGGQSAGCGERERGWAGLVG
jgi:hypothetical protein